MCDRRQLRGRPDGTGPGSRRRSGGRRTPRTARRINGVQLRSGHQFNYPVDPYVTPGNPASGLLPGISATPLAAHRHRRRADPGLQLPHVPDPRGEPDPVPAPGRLRRDPVRAAAAVRAGRVDRAVLHHARRRQRQDRLEQQRRVLDRLHRRQLRVPDGVVRGPRVDRRRPPHVPAGPDVVPGQRPATARKRPDVDGGVGPGRRRVHRDRWLAAPAVRARGAADARGVRDDRAQLPRTGDGRRSRGSGQLHNGLAQLPAGGRQAAS